MGLNMLSYLNSYTSSVYNSCVAEIGGCCGNICWNEMMTAHNAGMAFIEAEVNYCEGNNLPA